MRKRCHRKPVQKRTDTIALAILGSSAMSKPDQRTRLDVLEPAFQAFIEGRANDDQSRAVIGVHNLIVALAAMPGILGGQPHEFTMVCSDTLKDIAIRRQEGPPKPTQEEGEVLVALLGLYKHVIDNVAIRFIEEAEHRTTARIKRNDGVFDIKTAQAVRSKNV